MTKRILFAVMCTLLLLVIVMSGIVFHRVSALLSGPQVSAPPAESTEASQPGTTTAPATEATESTQATEPSQPTEPPHVHEYVKTSTVEPTCTAFGYTIYTCACGKTDLPAEEYREPYGHDYVEGEPVKRTCTEDGYIPFTCQTCDFVDKRNVQKAEGHTLGVAKVTAPTCEEEGYTVQTCSICREDLFSDLQEPLGHSYGEWTDISVPSDATPGLRQRQCAVCLEYDSEFVPPTGELTITNGNGKGEINTEIDSENKEYRRYTIVVGTALNPEAYTYTIDYYVADGNLTFVYGSSGLVITYDDAAGQQQTQTLLPYISDTLVIAGEEAPAAPEEPDAPAQPDEEADPAGE